jgi:mannose/cellobiose epimerase-like protein (N-acyl-D-glucosamine 2-epimerase family)
MLQDYASEFVSWLRNDALPIWWHAGADRVNGGFVETIGLDGVATDSARRGRVQPRQVYCYALAGKLGWSGPWQQALTHGLTYFTEKYWLESGYFANVVAPTGAMIDDSFDLYNQAFALFGFSQAAQAVPSLRADLEARSLALLQMLQARFKHDAAGFQNDLQQSLPLKSNPHMHLFEAALGWEEFKGKGNGPWTALADEIAELCMTRFIDARSGALREFFDAGWNPHPGEQGRIVEPGHQFEWAWLLTRWGQSRGNAEALVKAERLFEIGLKHGVCPARRVAVMSLLDDFSIHDQTARLWPQTEWLKSSLRLASVSGGLKKAYYLKSAEDACAAMRLFLDVPLRGLWRDKMYLDGSFLAEPAPASSFYHIACAIDELRQSMGVAEVEKAEPVAA